METVTLAERPDLADAVFAIPYPPGTARFTEGVLAASPVTRKRLAARWPHLVVALVDGGVVDGGAPVARGVLVPYSGAGRPELPDGGWDQVAVWAACDALDGVAADRACALEIAVHPDHLGRGLSAHVLAGMRRAVAAAGFDSFAVPLRPPDKAAEPDVPMDVYAARTREDGLPADRWLRTHVRAGGVVEGVARCSSTVVAPLAVWRGWTGLPFDRDGDVHVPGGLAPVRVSVARDVAVYVEANVWLRHRAGRGPDRGA
ncbi:hypothetical protein [Saccharothrix yanglingensis]|uniref:N-acetyltransferase domain-containing protein n=1 Tax=Saccharothrix yanglingensis TaxID=659496 RepID=A0ABU0X4R2_9PSEU|nr:hypothetical protein [Saccharothrix yanglingensis]MDQ2587126.1 hypothetical protein [Saccharothrix yanglingensis]